MHQKSAILWLVLVVTRISSVVRADEDATAILARYKESVDRLDRCEFSMELKGYFAAKGSAFEEETLLRESLWHCRRDGQRWRVESHDNVTNSLNGRIDKATTDGEYVVANQGHLNAQNYEGSDLRVSAALPGESPAVSQDAADPFAPWPRPFLLLEGAFLFGYLSCDGQTSLFDICARGAHRAQDEIVDGHQTIRIECTGPHGTHRLWLDPVMGCLPRRIEVEKSGDDLYSGKPVSAHGPHHVKGWHWPDLQLSRVSVVVDRVELTSLNESPAITGFTYNRTMVYDGGASARERLVVGVKDLQIDPTFAQDAFKVRSSIPNGTPVSVAGVSQIHFEWRDGKVLKVFDGLAGRETGGFKGPPRSLGTWAYLALISVSALGLVGLWRFFARRNTKST